MTNSPIKLLIAGGGTGGHLFPGIAMADAFVRAGSDNDVLFVSTGKPFEWDALERAGFPLRAITVEGIKGQSRWRQLMALTKLPRSFFQSVYILLTYRPDIVIGVGGYASGPVVVAAWLMWIPTALQEQNLLPGITNRILSRLVRRVYLSFPDVEGRFPAKKSIRAGNPIRRDIRELNPPPSREGSVPRTQDDDKATAYRPEPAPTRFTILIVGGSQGAHGINQAVIEALPLLRESGERCEIGRNGEKRSTPAVELIHQTGEADYEIVRRAFRRNGTAGVVAPFFHNMGERYAAADLIVCRAGATTIAEITAIGKPALFVPFPYAADDHQTKNAEVLVREGAARMIPESALTGEMLTETILAFCADRSLLRRMAERSAALGVPDAADRIIADALENLLPRKRRRQMERNRETGTEERIEPKNQ